MYPGSRYIDFSDWNDTLPTLPKYLWPKAT